MEIITELKESRNPDRVISALILIHFMVHHLLSSQFPRHFVSDVAAIFYPKVNDKGIYNERGVVQERLPNTRYVN